MSGKLVKVKEYYIKSPLCTIRENYTIKSFYQLLLNTQLPFAPVVNVDNEFLGNLWISPLRAHLPELSDETTIASLLSSHPHILDAEHFIESDSEINLTGSHANEFYLMPVIGKNKQVIGYLNKLDLAFESIISKVSLENTTKIKNILLVGPNEAHNTFIQKLQKDKFQCHSINSIKYLMGMIESKTFDLICLSLTEPIDETLKAIEDINENFSEIPVIILSDVAHQDGIVECLVAGATSFLITPVSYSLIRYQISSIEKLLSKKTKHIQNVKTNKLSSIFSDLVSKENLPLNDKLNVFCERLSRLLDCKNCSVILNHYASGNLIVRGSTNKNIRHRELKPKEAPILSHLIQDQNSLLINSEDELDRYKDKEQFKHSYESSNALVVPLFTGTRIAGFLTASDKTSTANFSQLDIELLNYGVGYLALLLDCAQLIEEETEQFPSKSSDTANPFAQDLAHSDMFHLTMLGEAASSISHDIKNPLTIAYLHAQAIIKCKTKDPEDIEKRCVSIFNSLGRINQIVESMIRLAQSGSQTESHKPFEIMSAMDFTLKMLASKMQSSGVTVELENHSSHPCYLMGNQVQFEQILSNLIANALDAVASETLPSVKVHIELLKDENTLQISICDNGPGIPQGLEEKVFKRFITTKEPGKGTGLGLHIASTLIENIKGSLQYIRNNKLTTFQIKVPLYSKVNPEE